MKHIQKRTKKGKNGLTVKQRAMIEALVSTLGNITQACKKCNVMRSSHYRWLEECEAYRQAYDEIDDMECDFYRTALHKLVQEGNVTAVIFGLKTKGKHRGYIERQEISTEVQGPIEFNIVAPNGKKKNNP